MAFVQATKHQARLRMAIHGPSGSGKTYSALAIASALVDGGLVAVVDTEHGSASKYADKFSFVVDEVTENYDPRKVKQKIAEAAQAGAQVVVFDSLTHFWNGPGGFLELVDQEVAKQKARGGKGDSFAAWKVIDPIYKEMVQALLGAPIHVLVTLRAKTEYDRSNGKVEKVGLAPEIRDTFQYEMDVEGMLDMRHRLVIGKTRCDALDDKVYDRPGHEVAKVLRAWLSDGAAPVAARPSPPPPSAPRDWPAVADDAKRIIDQCTTPDDLRAARATLAEMLPANEAPKPLRAEVGQHLVARERAIAGAA